MSFFDAESTLDDSSNPFRLAIAAEEEGRYEEAYVMFAELWESKAWGGDTDVLLHYANVCEQVGDHKQALKIYVNLMQTMTLNPKDITGTLIQVRVSRLNDILHDGTVERKIEGRTLDLARSDDEVGVVDELFKYGKEITLPQGSKLCEEGDIANHVWLLMQGHVDVCIGGKKIATLIGSYSNPCLMGEVSYFTGLRRSATLLCSAKVHLLELSFNDIQELIIQHKHIQPLLDYMFRSRLAYHLLSQHDIFKKVDEKELKDIALSMEHTNYLPSKVVIKQGSEKDGMFMVQSGTLLLLEKNEKGKLELSKGLHAGDIFHLGGLLQGFSPDYQVVTGTPCRLLNLNKKAFEPFVQKNPQIVKDIMSACRRKQGKAAKHPEKDKIWGADRNINLKK